MRRKNKHMSKKMKVHYSKNFKLIYYYVFFFCTRCFCDNMTYITLDWKTKFSARFIYISWNSMNPDNPWWIYSLYRSEPACLATPVEFSMQNGPRTLIFLCLLLKTSHIDIVTSRVVCVTRMTGPSSDDWDLLVPWLQSLLITLKLQRYRWFTHTS
jgi:hypothetical protein